MPLRDGFFSTATQTSCCNRIQRSNRVRLLVVSTHDFPDIGWLANITPNVRKYCIFASQYRPTAGQTMPTMELEQRAIVNTSNKGK